MVTGAPTAKTSNENPLLTLEALGQSIWMDYICRGTIVSGELGRLIELDGVSGVTSNPSIFEKAIAKINTIPLETLDAYRDHGHPEKTLDRDPTAAHQALRDLASLGLNLDGMTQRLEDEGVAMFIAAFDRLMVALKEKQAALPVPPGEAVSNGPVRA